LFSFTFGLVNLIGAAGTLLAGQLPGWFSTLSQQPAQSAIVYQQVMLATLAFGALALIPVFFIKEKKLPAHADQQKVSIKQVLGKGVVWRLVLPYLLLGVGSSNFYTYMNVFFTERFSLPSNSLGLLFGAFAILAGLGSLLSAKTAEIIGGKVRTMVVAWCLNLPALMLMALGNNFGLAAAGFLLRAITFNMATPLFSSFAMEQIHQREQGTVNSLLAMAWTVGSATGPYLSVKLQNQWGFTPVFGVTTVLTVGGALILWAFFGRAQKQIPGETELKIE
jgi:predicted MFS family arabinose efflux permease